MLTIVNAGDRVRKMAFGIHDHHQSYNGVTEKLLKQGEQLTITLNQPRRLLSMIISTMK